MAALAAVLPVNVWIYAGQLQNLRAAGPQVRPAGRHPPQHGGGQGPGGLHPQQGPRRRGRRPPVLRRGRRHRRRALRRRLAAGAATPRRFRGFDTIAALTYTSTTSRRDRLQVVPDQLHAHLHRRPAPRRQGPRRGARCRWPQGWERVISGNSCPKGLVEDVNEMRVVKAKLEEVKREYPNVAEMVRKDAFRRARAEPAPSRDKLRIGIPRVLNLWSTHQFWIGLFGALGVDPRNLVFSVRHLGGAGPPVRQGPRHRGLLLPGEVHLRPLRRAGLRPAREARHPRSRP